MDVDQNASGDGNATEKTNYVSCEKCHKPFSTVILLKYHYCSHFMSLLKKNYEHLLVGNNTCQECKRTFENSRRLLLHIGVNHDKINDILKSRGNHLFFQGQRLFKYSPATSTSTMVSPLAVDVKTKVGHEVEPSKTVESTRTPVEAVAVMEVISVQCFPCQENNKTRIFEKKSEFLKHLSLIHYGKQILQNYPYREGEKCDLCYDSAKKVYIPNKKELYVCHVSIIHQKLFELIPPEIDRQIKDMPSIKKQESGMKPPLSSSTTIPCKYCNEHVPRKDMHEHLIYHKAVISQKQSLFHY